MNTRAPASTAQTRPRGPPRTRDGHRRAPADRRPRPTHLTGWPVSRLDRSGTPELSSKNRDRQGCTGGHGSHCCDRAVIATVMIISGAAPALALHHTDVFPATPKPTTCRAPAAAVLEPDSEMGVLAARRKGAAHGWRIFQEWPEIRIDSSINDSWRAS
jgi:hypothetical protein